MLSPIKTGVPPIKSNLIKWGVLDGNYDNFDYDVSQAIEHLLHCFLPACPHRCILDEVWLTEQEALEVVPNIV